MKPNWKSDLIYRELNRDYEPEAISKRLEWLESVSGFKGNVIAESSLEGEKLKGNIENLIGSTQIPLGIAGPLKVNGEHASGVYYIPLATTEGALVKSYTRGMMALGHTQGITSRILKNTIHVSPLFYLRDLEQAIELKKWIESNFHIIKQVAECETKHGELVGVHPLVNARSLVLKLDFDTKDAMGLNMINIAASNVCAYICSKFEVLRSVVRSNYSSDKKANYANIAHGYGKEVIAEAILPARIVRKFFRVDPAEFPEYCHRCAEMAMQNGMIGLNGHFANGLSALFIATGQDPAQVVNSSAGLTSFELTAQGDLYASVKLFNLLVGTVGGGTGLPTQREALEMIDCYGAGKVQKFAEIIAATLLAGELSITAALLSQDFVNAHRKRHRYTKNLQ